MIEFEPSSTEFATDPYSVYAQLRKGSEPQYFEGASAWLLSRFRDVEAAALNSNMVRSAEGFRTAEQLKQQQREANWHDMPNHEKFIQFNLLERDGPEHQRLRRIVMRHMSRRLLEQQRNLIESFVCELNDKLLAISHIDFIEDLASQVPGHVIGSLLGVPAKDCGQLRIWSENVVQFFDVDRTPEHKILAETATTDFLAYLTELIAQREITPQEDLITALIAERNQGNMDDTELMSTCMLILMAGHGSTIDVLGTGMLSLLQNPDQLTLLRDNLQLTPQAIQEMFRYQSPLPFFHRYANQPVEVMGKVYPIGTKFGLLYGAANRDPEQFTDPDKFLISRTPNRHLAFARGAHLCLGNHLSRINMEVIFNTLLKSTRSIELEEEPQFRPGLSSRGLDTLRLSLIPA